MTNSPPKPEIQSEDIDLFYFESDHLALKGNIEYSELLKTIFILEAQRKRAIDDYNKVIELQKQAENDPFSVMEKLKKRQSLDIPDLQHIVEVPKINWSKFNLTIPESCLKAINDKNDDPSRIKTDDVKHKIPSTAHSKSWTPEEQKRLEELLIVYPPEEVELRRFRKIAGALGTRTVKQVCSRVQKYFIKLRKAGLPVPGRVPKLYDKKRAHKHQRFHYLLKPSTFFPDLDVPVVMNEDEDAPGPSHTSKSSDTTLESHSSNYLLSSNYHDDAKIERRKNELDLQINILKSVRNEKQRESESESFRPLHQHVGFRCDYCKEEPIKGSRWQCITCKSESIDFCTDCVLSQMYSEDRHPITHKFIIVRDDGSTLAPSSDSSCESEFSSVFENSNRNFETSDFNSEDYLEDDTEMEQSNKVTPFVRPSNLSELRLQDANCYQQINIKQEPSFISDDTNFEITSQRFLCDDLKCSTSVKSDTKDESLDSFNLNNKFTETQNVSYNYLHSKLFVDES